jgi:hypothetical protein
MLLVETATPPDQVSIGGLLNDLATERIGLVPRSISYCLMQRMHPVLRPRWIRDNRIPVLRQPKGQPDENPPYHAAYLPICSAPSLSIPGSSG